MLKNIKQLYSSNNLNNIIAVFIVTLLTLSFTGCSKEDAPITPEEEVIEITNGKVWSVSVNAKKEGESSSETKLLNNSSSDGSLAVEDGWEDGTKLLIKTGTSLQSIWEDDQIVEMYIGDGDTKIGELKVTVGGSNKAVLEGLIYYGYYSVGMDITLYTISKKRNYNNQKGTLEDLGANFDYAVAKTKIRKIDYENDLIYLDEAIFEPQQSINKILISPGIGVSINKLTISGSGLVGDAVTVFPENTPSGSTHELYVALSNTKDKKITYNFTMELSNGEVVTTYKKANLKNGKYYGTVIYYSAFYETIKEPLTIESLEDGGTITIVNPMNKEITYTINDPSPTELTVAYHTTDNPISISVNDGDRVQLYGKPANGNYGRLYSSESTMISCDVPHYVYGNTNSLRHSFAWWTDANSQEVSNYMFAHMFKYDSELLSHPSKKIILPAKTVGLRSYDGMFGGCEKMTIPPDLPATTLGAHCYDNMFSNCHELKYAPELPATTLADGCYNSMFYKCYSLVSSPVLPAKTLVSFCYNWMFTYCKNLKQIICYAQNISADCLSLWTYGVFPTGTFKKDEETSWPSGENGIPTGWGNDDPFTIEAIADGKIIIDNPQSLSIKYGKSILLGNAVSDNSKTITISVTAGDKVRFWGNNSVYGDYSERYLCTTIRGTAEHYAYGDLRSLLSDSDYPNITTLEEGAFCQLFLSNTQLKSHPTLELKLNVETVGFGGCASMFSNCTKLIRAPKLPAITLLLGMCYEGMFYNCTSLTEAPELPATELEYACYAGMFAGCTSLVNAPALPAKSITAHCYANMFDGCISLENAPKLEASVLQDYCYQYMFRDCKKLNKITCLAFTLDPFALEGWVDGVASTGTFTRKNGVTWPIGVNGIPSGWSVVNN